MMNTIKQWILSREFVTDSFSAHFNSKRDELYLQAYAEARKDINAFNEGFQSKREDVYKKAFNDAQSDLKETQVFDVEARAKELCESRLNEMLSVVDMNHVITVDKQAGIIYFGKERASDLQLTNLKAEAEFLVQSNIWKVLYETPKELAHRTMFVSSESLDDMKKGKSMLYTLDSQQKVVNMLRTYTPKSK